MEEKKNLIKLDQLIAQKIVNQLSNTINYNINIMDENGIIIASVDTTRIGKFHEIAFQILTRHQKQIDVYDSKQLACTKKGVNLALEYRNSMIGVVGVTGNPDEVRPIAALLKVAVENLYELELQQSAALNRTTKKDQLFHHLLYYNDMASGDIIRLATDLGYKTDCYRIPILFNVPQERDRETVSAICKASRHHTKQDMLIRSIEGNPLIFLYIEDVNKTEINYRFAVERYLEPIQQAISQTDIGGTIVVGSIQNELNMYHAAYQHCLWLMQSVQADHCWKTYWFYDHVQAYLQSILPLSELRSIFHAYTQMMPEKFWNNYKTIIRHMNDNMNNMVKTSAQLHMHKNTLVYRYNQIRNALQIDPLNNLPDAEFARNLCCYLEKEEDKPLD